MRLIYSVLIIVSLSSCGGEKATIEKVELPVAKFSEEPSFFDVNDTSVGLSWLEKNDDQVQMSYTVYENGVWRPVQEIVSGNDLLTNWADFPGVVTNGNNWLAWYLQFTNPETFAYDVMIIQSADGGETWSDTQKLHADSIQAEHGFVSAVPAEGGFQLIWLDGRNSGGGHGEGAMSLRAAFVSYDGTISHRILLDDSTCDCCQTTLAGLSEGGMMAIYRNRSEEEVRDMWYVTFDGTNNKVAKNVYEDKWHIEGCPVNGPRVVANGDEIAVVWFTMGQDEVETIKLAFASSPNSFSAPIIIDKVNLGRLDMVYRNGAYYISYLDKDESGTRLKVAVVKGKKVVNEFVIAEVSPSRKTGFPRMANVADGILIAFTNEVDKEVVVLKLTL